MILKFLNIGNSVGMVQLSRGEGGVGAGGIVQGGRGVIVRER